MSEFKREVRFEPGYDCIRFECASDKGSCKPGTGGSHGVHGMNVRFLLVKDGRAVQFLLFTGWLPRRVRSWRGVQETRTADLYPSAADLGYHSPEPMYEEHYRADEDCDVIGGPCYYDGSGLNAEDALTTLVNGGDDAIWPFLEDCWRNVFKDGPYPEAVAYRKPERNE